MDHCPPRAGRNEISLVISMNDENHINHLCPFLGLLDDPETSQGFPSIWNCCHHSQPIAPPALEYQEEFCLCGKHRECPVFLSQQAMPLPEDIRSPIVPVDGKRSPLRQKLIIGLTSLGAMFVLVWGVSSNGMFVIPGIGKSTQISIPTTIFTATETPSPVTDTPPSATMTSSPFPTLTIPASPSTPYTPTLFITATSTVTPSPYDVLIGSDYKFVIHKVLTGENLKQYAAKYNTSVETILAVNHGITVPVWVNTLVIIPVGFTDYAKLPSFVVYQVKQEERGVSVEEMARKLKVDPVDLKYYNGWTSPGDRPLVGQFLLVPRYDHLSQ
jgi:hypothetical protein